MEPPRHTIWVALKIKEVYSEYAQQLTVNYPKEVSQSVLLARLVLPTMLLDATGSWILDASSDFILGFCWVGWDELVCIFYTLAARLKYI